MRKLIDDFRLAKGRRNIDGPHHLIELWIDWLIEDLRRIGNILAIFFKS